MWNSFIAELHMPGSWALVCHGETVFTRNDSVVVIQERDAQLIMYAFCILSFYSTNYDFSSVCLCSEMLSPPSMPDAKRMQKIPSYPTWMALNAENFETLLISCSIPSSFSHHFCSWMGFLRTILSMISRCMFTIYLKRKNNSAFRIYWFYLFGKLSSLQIGSCNEEVWTLFCLF
jgi:hypothetical protein